MCDWQKSVEVTLINTSALRINSLVVSENIFTTWLADFIFTKIFFQICFGTCKTQQKKDDKDDQKT